MPNVEIYTSMFCGYCHRAKRLLEAKGVAFTEIDVGGDHVRRQEMAQRAGRTSVPWSVAVPDQITRSPRFGENRAP